MKKGLVGWFGKTLFKSVTVWLCCDLNFYAWSFCISWYTNILANLIIMIWDPIFFLPCKIFVLLLENLMLSLFHYNYVYFPVISISWGYLEFNLTLLQIRCYNLVQLQWWCLYLCLISSKMLISYECSIWISHFVSF